MIVRVEAGFEGQYNLTEMADALRKSWHDATPLGECAKLNILNLLDDIRLRVQCRGAAHVYEVKR